MNNKYYFTYGTEGYPYYGGWTEVYADDEKLATSIFRSVHPDTKDGFVNCAKMYDEESFKNTKMYKNGNFGNYAHEVIQITVTSCTPAIDAYIDYGDI